MAFLTPAKLIKMIWRTAGSIHLTVGITLLLTADLAYGYICLNRNIPLFAPLNDIGLTEWLGTYGRHNLAHTAWFYLLLALLTLLGVNTFVCTTERIFRLWKRRKHFTGQRLFFKFAPHVMHYALIVILSGYLCSYLFTRTVGHLTLIDGKPATLPRTTAQIALKSFNPEYYQADRLPSFKDRVLIPRAHLLLEDGDMRRTVLLTANHPLRFKGYAIFLKDFAPKLKGGGMNRKVRVDLTLRKDPGVKLYLVGILLFTIGLVMYLADGLFVRQVFKEAI